MFPNAKPRNPIGVFDSGIGGLTVANAINRQLPNEEIVYYGDTIHLPYGDKSADAIRYYSIRIAKFLLEKGCKMIVIACNSASSAAYEVLLDFFKDQTLFVNVVDPLVDEIVAHNYHKVGVIATKATISSGIYSQKIRENKPEVDVIAQATPLLVPMIEEGFFESQISKSVIEQYLGVPEFENLDALLLACTHYPLIRHDIEDYLKGKTEVFDSTDVVVTSIRQRLEAHNLLNDKKREPHHFYVSDLTRSFQETTRFFYPGAIKLERCSIWKE